MNPDSGAPRKPARLHEGDTVAVIAPASSWENRSELLRGVAGLEAWGLQVRLGEHVNDRHGYMAGTDADRAADLHAALRDPEVRAIVCLQGGYGTPRLIPLLDEAAFEHNPKALCGFSDLTTLHLAQQRWANVISFYSNGAAGIGSADVTEFSKASLKRALFSAEPYGQIGPNPDDPYVRTIVGGRVTGRLAGGCAGLLSSATGTRWPLALLMAALLGQSVLLRGVNDSAEALEALFRAMLASRVKPYYLHQLDRAPGTARFEVPIAEGRALLRELRGRVSGLAWPTYVLDSPDGGGKAPLGPDFARFEDGEWRVDAPLRRVAGARPPGVG